MTSPICFTVPGEPKGDGRKESAAARVGRGLSTGCVAPKRAAIKRLAERCERVGDCLVWRGFTDRKGYARFRDDSGRKVSAHRFAYEAELGPIPAGLTIDHLCRNPSCCEPRHLEAVTDIENIRRGTQGQAQRSRTHCPQGHPYSGPNLYVNPRGERLCRACQRTSGARHDKLMRRRGTAA